jgi:hypothetical protein
VRDVGLVGLEEVDPDERPVGVDRVVVGEKLIDAALGIDELELDVLEACSSR